MISAPRSSRLKLTASLLVSFVAPSPAALAQAPAPQPTADIPPSITTSDTVETNLGTLNFKDGAPAAATVAKIYDNLSRCSATVLSITTVGSPAPPRRLHPG
jgi:hypothetical protein